MSTNNDCRCDKTRSPFHTHGYVPGSPIEDRVPPNRKRGPRSRKAFSHVDGVIPGLGDREPRVKRAAA